MNIIKGLAAVTLLAASASASALQVYMIQDGLHSLSSGSASSLKFDTGSLNPLHIPSDATWDWNSGTGVLTQTGGTLRSTRNTGPPNWIYEDTVTGLVIDTIAGTTTASSYTCTDGTFGVALTGANSCGSYSLGANFIDESVTTFNIGGDASCESIATGGDDGAFSNSRGLRQRAAGGGCIQTVGARDMTNIFSDLTGSGGNLTLWNANGGITGVPGSCVGFPGAANLACNGAHWMTFSTVPVPAAVWLFGSAMGLLGVARRRAVATA